MNTAVLTGRQVSQGMKVFIVSQAGTVADVTLQSSCHSEDESVLKVRGFPARNRSEVIASDTRHGHVLCFSGVVVV